MACFALMVTSTTWRVFDEGVVGLADAVTDEFEESVMLAPIFPRPIIPSSIMSPWSCRHAELAERGA